MMGDITSGCTLKRMAALAGINIAIVQTAATADDGDTIELDTLLDSDGGTRVKKILYCNAMLDPTGTAVNDPVIWSDTTDTITLGGSTDNKRRDITIFYE
jgi:hypothetical protein